MRAINFLFQVSQVVNPIRTSAKLWNHLESFVGMKGRLSGTLRRQVRGANEQKAPKFQLPQQTAFEAFAVDVYFEIVHSRDLDGFGERGVGLHERGDLEVAGAFFG